MRLLICVPRLTLLTIITFALLFHITAAQQQFIDTEEVDLIQQEESNIDDTSLFRRVENAIDEDSEDNDAYRILKSLQDVTEDDFSEDDEEIEHSSSKEIKERIQPEENDNDDEDQEEDTTEVNMDDDDDDEEEEEEEEEDDDDEDDDDDFSADSFPDFKNEATTDFFEHIPQQPLIPEKGIDAIEEEEADEDDIVENHNDIHEEEYTDDDEDEEESKVLINNNNNNNVPVLPPTNMHDNTIPWHRAGPLDKVVVDDNKFYQDTNYNYSYEKVMKKQRSTAGFRLWHGILILLILVIIYKSSNKKKSHHILDSNNSSSLPWNNNEKDYLPLHNNKGNRQHKWEIKSC